MASNENPIPQGVRTATEWAWRTIIISAAVFGLLLILQKLLLLIIPVFVALLLTSLGNPAVNFLERKRLPRFLASLAVVISSAGLIFLLGYFVYQQITVNIGEFSAQVSTGLEKIRLWLSKGPLQLSDSQFSRLIHEAQTYVQAEPERYIEKVSEISQLLIEAVAAVFIGLFSFYFFLKDGRNIWQWLVTLLPSPSRNKMSQAGVAAWKTLAKYSQATLVVSMVNALGIMALAFIFNLPLIVPLGVIVFLTSFIPIIGILLAGSLSVIVALVAQGPLTALVMVVGVVVAHEIEVHLLQPLIMGRFVSLHPLGVILTVATGLLLAGIPGALVAVPLVAIINTVFKHLSDENQRLTLAALAKEKDSPVEGLA
jgi:predicted PurR-regulated permease PerM